MATAKNAVFIGLQIVLLVYSMACVSREHEIKTKIVYEQWLQFKMLFLFVYSLKNFIQWERINLWGDKIWWWELANFWLVEKTPSVEKTLHSGIQFNTFLHTVIWISDLTLDVDIHLITASIFMFFRRKFLIKVFLKPFQNISQI